MTQRRTTLHQGSCWSLSQRYPGKVKFDKHDGTYPDITEVCPKIPTESPLGVGVPLTMSFYLSFYNNQALKYIRPKHDLSLFLASSPFSLLKAFVFAFPSLGTSSWLFAWLIPSPWFSQTNVESNPSSTIGNKSYNLCISVTSHKRKYPKERCW